MGEISIKQFIGFYSKIKQNLKKNLSLLDAISYQNGIFLETFRYTYYHGVLILLKQNTCLSKAQQKARKNGQQKQRGALKAQRWGTGKWDWFWWAHVVCEGAASSFASGNTVAFVRTPGYSQRSVVFSKSQTHRQR